MSLPIDPQVLAAFAAASIVLLVIPGPTIVMVVSQALAHGRSVALAAVLGVGLGDLLAASLSLIGIGTVLQASSTAFLFVKWAGAAYLVWIGWSMWRNPVTPVELEARGRSARGQGWPVFRDAFLVTLFNPKGIVFFMAFVPQFIAVARPFAPQATLLIAVFVLLGMMNAAAYALAASSARDVIRRPYVLRIATRFGAAFLISAGIASIFVKRAT